MCIRDRNHGAHRTTRRLNQLPHNAQSQPMVLRFRPRPPSLPGRKPGFEDALQEFRRNAGPVVLDREQHRARHRGRWVRRIVPQILRGLLSGCLAVERPEKTRSASALRRDADAPARGPGVGRVAHQVHQNPRQALLGELQLAAAGQTRDLQFRHRSCHRRKQAAHLAHRLGKIGNRSLRKGGLLRLRSRAGQPRNSLHQVRRSRRNRPDLRGEVAVMRRQHSRLADHLGAEPQRGHQVARVMGNPCQCQSIAALLAQRGCIPHARKRKARQHCGRDRCCGGRRLSRRFHGLPPSQSGGPRRSGGRRGSRSLVHDCAQLRARQAPKRTQPGNLMKTRSLSLIHI